MSLTWLVHLLLRPTRFFGGLARNRVDPRAIIAIWIVGASFAMGRLDRMLIQADMGRARPASDTLLPMLTESWTGFWMLLLLGGALWAVFSWYVGGWWYGLRLRWSGVASPPALEPRLLHTYSTLVTALPSLVYAIVVTLVFDSYADAWASDESWSTSLLVFPFWSVVTSYRGLSRWYHPIRPWAARVWFIILPCAVYLVVYGLIALASGILTAPTGDPAGAA